MDTAVKPGDDFFRYVNGKWLATTVIPADKARFGMFDALRDKSEADVRALVDELGRTPAPAGTIRQKVADLYASWMDEARIEARGLEPLRADLAAIDAASTKTDLIRLMGRTEFSAPFGFGINADPADPTRYVVTISQAGLGMPVRDYYLAPGEKFDGYRAAYRTYVTRIFELLGDPAPAESAATVIALETKLAQAHWPRDQRRDVKATNNPMDRAGLAAAIPAMDWQAALEPGGLGAVSRVVVREVSAIKGGAALLDTEPVAAWKKYLAFHLADDASDYLPKAFDDASFAFHSKVLRGVEVQRERWKRGVALLDGLIGQGLGELYVARHFPPGHKAAMDALVANLRTAMGERLKTLAWMDDKTRAEAQKKLATFEPRIGYPSKWRDYSAFTVDKASLFENVRRGREFDWRRRVARLGGPVDRTEWGMLPQTVNAQYSPSMNQITFPAAILQPPFFDPAADPAVNYGGIGAVIGHEMGHGFDDQGRESRRGRPDPQLVDRGDEPEVPGPDREAGGAVQRVLPAGRRVRERQADDGREHRRPGRPGDGLHGLQAVARRQGRAGARRLHRRPALLPVARADLARHPARRCAAQPDPDRLARAGRRARLDPRAQHRRLVHGVRRQAGRQGLPRAGAARAHLVKPRTGGRP